MRVCTAFGLVMLVAACAGDDFSRPGTWQAIGVNDANLHAMLADPTHAVRGAAAGSERGQPGSVAIHRLEQGRRPPLPDTRVSRVGATGAAPAGGANAR